MSTSRIATSQVFGSSQTAIDAAREKEMATAEKSETLKELIRPSQDPGNWKQAATLKDDLSIQEGIIKDATLGNHVLNATDQVVSQIQNNVQRAYELAISVAGNEPYSVGSRQSVLPEIQGLLDSTLQLANTKYGDRTLFSGLKTQGPAFDSMGNYVGDTNSLEIEIARGQRMAINLTGDKALMGQGVVGGVNIMGSFQSLVTGLTMNDTEAIRGAIDNFKGANDQLSLMRTELGARMATIKRAIDTQSDHKLNTQASISHLEDADCVKTFSDLARDQTVLKSAMSTTQKILSDNPTDILFK